MNQATWGERGPVKNLLSTLPTENCQPGRQGMLSVLKKNNVGLSSSQSQVWFFTTLGTLPLSKLGKLSPPPFSPNSPSLPPSACCLSQLLLSLGPACMLATDNLVKDWTNWQQITRRETSNPMRVKRLYKSNLYMYHTHMIHDTI